jgi:putative nucleotidyltransferase with HDIG domain
MKKKILFVDDEPNLLQGLQRMLRPMREEWEMSFVQSGAEALELLGQQNFDVVVSDMRMPGMDGAQLLAEVQRRFPQIIRIILSGHSDKEFVLRSVKAVHQYLSKPCEPETLKAVISRACSLDQWLAQDSLKKIVSQITVLPSLPSLYLEIVEALNSPDISLHKIGDIISKDIGMTAKILQLVNSAFFGLPRRISNPNQAVTLLGLDLVKTLVLSLKIFQQFDQKNISASILNNLWQHSFRTGVMAKKIAQLESQGQKLIDDAFTSGLLHDLGKPILLMNFPERYKQIEELKKQRQISTWVGEKEIIGAEHSIIGAYLLRLWGLPDSVVEAVAFHHSFAVDCPGFTPLLATQAANIITHLLNNPQEYSPDISNMDYWGKLGLTDKFRNWIEICKKMDNPEEEGEENGTNFICR